MQSYNKFKSGDYMILLPAIDIRGGNAVRLYQGDYDKEKVYSDDPVKVVLSFKEAGASAVPLVDLAAALAGSPVNFSVIKEIIAACGLFAEVGGGVRSLERIEQYLKTGAGRVILGSAAVHNFPLVGEAVKFFGDRVAVGVDAYGGKVATGGWKNVTGLDAFDFCKRLEDCGVRTVIYTDISRDGTLAGTNLNAYKKLKELTKMDIVASGGIADISELIKLKEMGVSGAVLGKAIYDGAIEPKEAVEAVKDAG